MKDKYINPFTDFGFKKLFGEEVNKNLLIDFLNELLQINTKIIDLSFLKTENLGASEQDRKAIYDLYCKNDKGERFIVELQKAKQRYFKDRSLYYSTFAIQEQGEKGEWDYKLQNVHAVSIMDFTFDESIEHKTKMRHEVQLLDIDTKELFYDKLRFVYLEMPKFTKAADELETHYDKWLYTLKNMSKLDSIPEQLQEGIFLQVFEVAEIAKYNQQERLAYQDSLKYYRDMKNVLDTAIEEAIEGAIQKRNTEIVETAILAGSPDSLISTITGIDIEVIQRIRRGMSIAE